MTHLARIFATILAALFIGPALAQSADPLAGGKIAEAIVYQGKLFLRGALENPQTGALVSIDLGTGARTVLFDRGVIDIDAGDGNLWVVKQATEAARNFNILQWNNGAFEGFGNTSAGVPQPIAITENSRNIVLVTPVSLHTFDKSLKRWGAVKLKGSLRYGVTFNVAMTKSGDAIYFGANPLPSAPPPTAGGRSNAQAGTETALPQGVIQRIDVSSGAVTNIEKLRSSNPCDGPLSSTCSTVTAVIPDPANGGCVIASVGYVRGEVSDGRVLRVCGTDVTIVFEQKAPNAPAEAMLTEPIWGLSPAPDGFWAVGRSMLYRFKGDAHADSPLPAVAPYGGTPIGRGTGAITVPTSVASAMSVSGYTTLVAASE